MKLRLFVVLAANFIAGPSALSAADQPSPGQVAAEKPDTVALLQSLGGGTKKDGVWQLARHWTGTMQTISKSPLYVENNDLAHRPHPVRFGAFAESFERVGKERAGPGISSPGHTGRGGFIAYRSALPPSADFKDPAKLAGIFETFGRQHGFTDAFGSEDHWHWTEGWKWFTVENGKVRYLTVFAHVSRQKGKPKQVDEWIVDEANLSSVDPGNAKEAAKIRAEDKKQAKTEAKDRAREEATYNKIPEPLRRFVRTRNGPGDPELNVLFAAISEFRAAPDGVLVKQMVARLDDGTAKVSQLLERLFDSRDSNDKAEAWKPEKQQEARALLLDALPEAKTAFGLREAVELALRETGVESLKLNTEQMEVSLSSRYMKSGKTTTVETFTLKSIKVRRAGEIIREDILQRWQKGK